MSISARTRQSTWSTEATGRSLTAPSPTEFHVKSCAYRRALQRHKVVILARLAHSVESGRASVREIAAGYLFVLSRPSVAKAIDPSEPIGDSKEFVGLSEPGLSSHPLPCLRGLCVIGRDMVAVERGKLLIRDGWPGGGDLVALHGASVGAGFDVKFGR